MRVKWLVLKVGKSSLITWTRTSRYLDEILGWIGITDARNCEETQTMLPIQILSEEGMKDYFPIEASNQRMDPGE